MNYTDRYEFNPNISYYESAQKGNSYFESKLLDRLKEKPNNDWLLWIKDFADKISFCPQDKIKEAGIALVDRLLDFHEDSPLAHAIRIHLEELVQTEGFLNKCVQNDVWALN